MIDTYGTTFEDGTLQHGGYANYIRAHTQFAFKVPVGSLQDGSQGRLLLTDNSHRTDFQKTSSHLCFVAV
jgi:hypothetical protein